MDVQIRRQWNDYRIGTVNLEDIENLCWDRISGGVHNVAPQPFIHGNVYCDKIDGEIGHSCIHGIPPHYIKVCLVKKDNDTKIWNKILEIVGPKPKKKTSKL